MPLMGLMDWNTEGQVSRPILNFLVISTFYLNDDRSYYYNLLSLFFHIVILKVIIRRANTYICTEKFSNYMVFFRMFCTHI